VGTALDTIGLLVYITGHMERLQRYGPDVVGVVVGATLGAFFLLKGGQDAKDGMDGFFRLVDFGLSLLGVAVAVRSGLGFLATREIRLREINRNNN